eukprot:6024375-Ditylum_brightwellii.AAC.1
MTGLVGLPDTMTAWHDIIGIMTAWHDVIDKGFETRYGYGHPDESVTLGMRNLGPKRGGP